MRCLSQFMAPPSVAPCPARVLLVSTPSPPSLSRRRPAGRRCGGGDGGARLRTIRCGAATEEEDGDRRGERVEAAWEEEVAAPGRDLVTLAACLVGLLSGVSVVLFNLSVHEIRDLFWDGIPLRGASWLREESIGEIWQRVILVPVSGGIIVGVFNTLRSSIATNSNDTMSKIKGAFRPFLKAMAASFTLGTGNSLGPEGPSVEIGSSIAKGFGNVFKLEGGKKLSLVAAGSAAGIASGFNAAVAGCFFAVESVLWPTSVDSSSLSNSTPMVILSAVIASVVSEIGLGSDPAFTVPEYDFRSPTELPLYLLLGIFCGLVSTTLSRCTALSMEIVQSLQTATGLPKAASPALGGLIVGLLALVYPEVLYWGFENVDILLESRPFTSGLSAAVLVQLIGVKVLATSLCRAFGLVGGYYAPSLFIGAATGMAYGKVMRFTFTGPDSLFQIPFLDVASPQAYGLVGMAATLAGVCKRFSRSNRSKPDSSEVKSSNFKQEKSVPSQTQGASVDTDKPITDLCKLESSLCVYDAKHENFQENLTVAEAMKTKYISVSKTTPVVEALNLMLVEKQPFVMIIESNRSLIGLVTLKDIQDFCRTAKTTRVQTEEPVQTYVCGAVKCKMWPVTPQTSLTTVEKIMDSYGVDQLPVVSEHVDRQDRGLLVGFVDKEGIAIARRAVATKDLLSFTSEIKGDR
ncbi:chloride channel protein CLC-e isoform X2 [Oryza sativa Japonica Group]|uniref:chloride channel protein CLC-e isoform X2 n=1 Tax=Oryza sativa subsp. japonica TaxID=39947 RepID=UPI00077539AF|nr:chloride channel protein CLC-e isoform X2 [Oryza sativa Japonica Group]